MKKSEFWDIMWIPITKRIPPFEDDLWVLLWHPTWDEPYTMQSYIAHETAKRLLKCEYTSKDREFSHWCRVVKPKRKKRK